MTRCSSVRALPEVQHQTGPRPRLGGLPLRDVVQEQFAVGDHGERSLPAFLHAAGLRDLTQETGTCEEP